MKIAKRLKEDDEKQRSICEIQLNPETEIGFFIKIKKKRIYNFLITCYHVLSESIKDKSDIVVRLKDKKKYAIQLDNASRLIKSLEDKDIAAIEILNGDKLKNSAIFLNVDDKNNYEYEHYKNKDIIILEYRNDIIYKKEGEILAIQDNKFEFKHNLSTIEGSDSSPIILDGSSIVIGIQKKSSIGIFIEELLRVLE